MRNHNRTDTRTISRSAMADCGARVAQGIWEAWSREGYDSRRTSQSRNRRRTTSFTSSS